MFNLEDKYAVIVNNLTAGYGDKIILSDISFSVRQGEILALIGGSGCGIVANHFRSTKSYH